MAREDERRHRRRKPARSHAGALDSEEPAHGREPSYQAPGYRRSQPGDDRAERRRGDDENKRCSERGA